MIALRGVTKRYGVAVALRNVDLEVREGEAVALFGHNGSGKTTLLKLVAGLLRPTAGTVAVAGSVPRAVRGRIGYVGHEPYLYPYLTVDENLSFYARLYGVPGPSDPPGPPSSGGRSGHSGGEAGARPEELLERVGMAHRRDALVHSLSRGETQRVSIARALLHDPDVLLADEPFSGLDPAAAAAIPALLQREGRTILLASHDRDQAMAVCERSVTLELGRVKTPSAAEGSAESPGDGSAGTTESSAGRAEGSVRPRAGRSRS